jgi:hypothetical protein
MRIHTALLVCLLAACTSSPGPDHGSCTNCHNGKADNGSGDGSGDGSDSGVAHVGASWTIKDSPQDTGTLACPAGYDTAALVNQPIDSAGNNAGSPIVDLFDCAAGQGTSADLPAATYLTWIQITDASGSNVYAKTVPARLDVTDVDLTYNADILENGGYFQLQWSLVGASSNEALSCADAGVTGAQSGVELVSTVSSGTDAKTDQFTCEDGVGVTAGLPTGTYTVSLDAFTTAGAVGTAPTINTSIGDRNQITDLGTVSIPITGH